MIPGMPSPRGPRGWVLIGNKQTTQVTQKSIINRLDKSFETQHKCNSLTAKLFNLNFHPLEVVSR